MSGIPIPTEFDVEAEPTATIIVHEFWFSLLFGMLSYALDRNLWETMTDEEWDDTYQSILTLMTIADQPIGATMQFKTGAYTGNAAEGRAITGVGFQPEALFIFMQTSAVAVDKVYFYYTGSSELGTSGAVDSLDSDGFTVSEDGQANSVNNSSATYHYLALADL